MVWQLVLDLGGQFRVVCGPRRLIRTGYDMTAVMAMAAARAVPPAAVAEFLPIIERAAIAGFNRSEED